MKRLKILFLAVAYICGFVVYLQAEDSKEWIEYKQRSHFIIYYKNAPLDFIESVAEMAEKYYEEIARDLGYTRYVGWTWEDRAKIYIYDSTDDYVSSSHQASWSHGSASPQSKVIRTFPSAHGFFDSTLPHELGHIIFREFVGLKAQVPLWFEEGVAMYQEKAKRWGANDLVKQALKDGRFISLKELSIHYPMGKMSAEDVELFYAESASVVYYLIQELGEHRFVQFCRELQEGRPFEWSLESSYVRFNNLEDLNKAWLSYLGQ
jgi:hypothetical protein